MPVTDESIATLRALLAGESNEYERLYAQLDPIAKRTAYLALIDVAFFKAVHRRFGAGRTASEVIEFVGDVRGRSDKLEEQVDPRVAERLIGAALGDVSIDDIDDKVRFSTELMVLAVLISDEQLDTAGLDSFLDEARKLADR
ncbi:MAG: hypothetical protein JWP48_2430 [Actinoallomurus sp.]|nr:hypothetical protein [Actinoallomurus sp.]